jgi:hypothetical protein
MRPEQLVCQGSVAAMDLDEVDLALLKIYGYGDGDEWGVCPRQMRRVLAERIATAYLIVSEVEDAQADDLIPPIAVH